MIKFDSEQLKQFTEQTAQENADYEQNKIDEAYDTATKALDVLRDHEILAFCRAYIDKIEEGLKREYV